MQKTDENPARLLGKQKKEGTGNSLPPTYPRETIGLRCPKPEKTLPAHSDTEKKKRKEKKSHRAKSHKETIPAQDEKDVKTLWLTYESNLKSLSTSYVELESTSDLAALTCKFESALSTSNFQSASSTMYPESASSTMYPESASLTLNPESASNFESAPPTLNPELSTLLPLSSGQLSSVNFELSTILERSGSFSLKDDPSKTGYSQPSSSANKSQCPAFFILCQEIADEEDFNDDLDDGMEDVFENQAAHKHAFAGHMGYRDRPMMSQRRYFTGSQRGSLWCRVQSYMVPLEGCGRGLELHGDSPSKAFVEVSDEHLKYLLEVKALQERLMTVLSGQLDGVRLEVGEQVLVADEDEDTGTPDNLKKATILELQPNGIVVEMEEEEDDERDIHVTLNNVFHQDYIASKPSWARNILESHETNKIVTFLENNHIRVGRLKWKGKVPWSNCHLMGIECIKVDFDGEQCFVNRIRVMDAAERSIRIVEETDVKTDPLHLLKFDVGERAKKGALFCRRGLKMLGWDEAADLDWNETRFVEVRLELVPFLLRSARKARPRMILTGQLDGLQLQKGEQVVVRRSETRTGDPFDDLQRAMISDLHEDTVLLEDIGPVTLDRIFTLAYLKSYPNWAMNRLGQSGFQHLPLGQEIHFENSGGATCHGKVIWFGQLPWFQDMTVGIEQVENHNTEKDFRFLEYIQIMHCDANKAVLIPFRLVPEDYIGGSEMSNFIEEASRKFPIGSSVSFIDEGENRLLHGDVQWTGRHRLMFAGSLAVVVLREKHRKGTNGVFHGQKLVKCAAGRGLLVGTSQLVRIQELSVGDRVQCIVDPNINGTVLRILGGDAFSSKVVEFGVSGEKRGSFSKHCFELKKCGSVKSEVAVTTPIGIDQLAFVCGEQRGIQGSGSDNFLECLLFALFGFTSAFETYVQKMDREDLRQLLLYSIIYPLRVQKFVPCEKISAFRQLQAPRMSVPGQLDGVDRWMHFVFGQEDRLKSCLQISDNLGLNELFTKFAGVGVITSQNALEFGAMCMNFKISKMPKTCVLQFPLNENNRMALIPSPTLNLTYCFDNHDFKFCAHCGCQAQYFDPELFNPKGLRSIFFCEECKEIMKLTDARSLTSQMTDSLVHSTVGTEMDLRAVICGRNKKYSCFARIGDPKRGKWVFFNSDFIHDKSRSVPKVEVVEAAHWMRKALFEGKMSNEYISDHAYTQLLRQPRCLIYELRSVPTS